MGAGSYLLVGAQEAVGVDDNEGCRPVFALKVIGVVLKILGSLKLMC